MQTSFTLVGCPLQNHWPSFAKLPMLYIPQSQVGAEELLCPLPGKLSREKAQTMWRRLEQSAWLWVQADQTDPASVNQGRLRSAVNWSLRDLCMVWLRPLSQWSGVQTFLFALKTIAPPAKLPNQKKKKSMTIVKSYLQTPASHSTELRWEVIV